MSIAYVRMETNRLFLSIPIPEKINEIFEEKIASYHHIKAKWIAKEKRHITLLFIGKKSKEETAALDALIKEKTEKLASFYLTFDSISFFPSERAPQMIWARFCTSPQFVHLSAAFAEALNKKEDHETIPHVTLARLKSQQPLQLHFPQLELLVYLSTTLIL